MIASAMGSASASKTKLFRFGSCNKSFKSYTGRNVFAVSRYALRWSSVKNYVNFVWNKPKETNEYLKWRLTAKKNDPIVNSFLWNWFFSEKTQKMDLTHSVKLVWEFIEKGNMMRIVSQKLKKEEILFRKPWWKSSKTN